MGNKSGSFRYVLLVAGMLCGLLVPGSGTLVAQINSDSTTTAPRTGKGAIKDRVLVTGDSTGTVSDTSPVDSLATAVIDTPGTDSIPTDTTIGPVRKKASKDRKAKLKVGQDRPLPDPKIAVRRSMILPGLGQIYNRSWWKVPIIYGGFATFTYLFFDQNKQYQSLRRIAVCKGDSTCDSDALYPDYALFDISSVINERDFYRRNRDLNVILAVLWYTLQSVDAYVEAHLKGFNVSNDLSMRVKPSMSVDPFRRSSLMMGATLSFKLRR